MIFPRNKLVPVQYIIDTANFQSTGEGTFGTVPKGIFPDIEKQYVPLDIGCPAIAAANNKLFDVYSPFTFELKFGCDKSGIPYWKYEFDSKVHPAWTPQSVREILNKVITHNATAEGTSVAVQLGLPYALVTDEPDLCLTVIPPHSIEHENCSFISGEFIITDWIRLIASAWVLDDVNKEAVVQFKVNKPCASLYFNKQISMSYTEATDEISKYRDQMSNVTFYTNSVSSLFTRIKNRRPKRLLAKN